MKRVDIGCRYHGLTGIVVFSFSIVDAAASSSMPATRPPAAPMSAGMTMMRYPALSWPPVKKRTAGMPSAEATLTGKTGARPGNVSANATSMRIKTVPCTSVTDRSNQPATHPPAKARNVQTATSLLVRRIGMSGV